MAGARDARAIHGEVVAAHGRHYIVELDDGGDLRCYPRGKKSSVACGDRVQVSQTSATEGVIEAVDPRRTLLYRADQFKQKLIAANVTQVAIVVACSPSFYDELVTRCLIAASTQALRAIIVLNKSDLNAQTVAAQARLAMYAALGYAVLPVSAHYDISALRPLLAGERTVFVGQSGMGKSSLINALVPAAGATVGETSLALDSGRHTTTATYRYRMDANTFLFDSPGMQEFGVAHLTPTQIMQAFPEFASLLGKCRFSDCLHLTEPGCAVTAAANRIHPERLRIYRKLVAALANAVKRY